MAIISLKKKQNVATPALTPLESVSNEEMAKRLQMALWRLKRSGLTWREVGQWFGKSKGVAHLIASGRWVPKIEKIEKILSLIPDDLFWHGPAELDDLVLSFLEGGKRLTGTELGRLCGTSDRTIRGSIKRLRERGIKINASMAPPRGYRLEGDDGAEVS